MRPLNPDMKSLEVKKYLDKQQSRTVGETSQKQNTSKMLNKYLASFKQIRSVVNHTAADKNNTWKSREEISRGKQAKTWLLKAV